jgi:hypothetical protein
MSIVVRNQLDFAERCVEAKHASRLAEDVAHCPLGRAAACATGEALDQSFVLRLPGSSEVGPDTWRGCRMHVRLRIVGKSLPHLRPAAVDQFTPAEAGHRRVISDSVDLTTPTASYEPYRQARFWQLTWAQLRDRILDRELVDSSTFDLAVQAMSDPRFTELSPGMITTYGRRPGQR